MCLISTLQLLCCLVLFVCMLTLDRWSTSRGNWVVFLCCFFNRTAKVVAQLYIWQQKKQTWSSSVCFWSCPTVSLLLMQRYGGFYGKQIPFRMCRCVVLQDTIYDVVCGAASVLTLVCGLHGVVLSSTGLQWQHSTACGCQPAVSGESVGCCAPANAEGSWSECQKLGEWATSSSGSWWPCRRTGKKKETTKRKKNNKKLQQQKNPKELCSHLSSSTQKALFISRSVSLVLSCNFW